MSIKIDQATCIGCGTCVDTCPLELIDLADGMAVINDEDACIECGACVNSCPLESITL
ncbi:MAG: 4Fe-4S binding protein [Coriobacteriales bacterium]|jgi:NAD-dependent dihydropyrimidine dehydrogenase PreA subunit|nr:4Fe-4S binding protein [Coriobacteriales bacterium]